jgi:quinol monooxygenase YgiN
MPSLIATVRVKEEKVEEARSFFKELGAQVSRDEPGTLAYVIHQKKDEPQTFVVYEKYESDEAFKTHQKNLGKVAAQFGAILAGAPELVVLEEI